MSPTRASLFCLSLSLLVASTQPAFAQGASVIFKDGRKQLADRIATASATKVVYVISGARQTESAKEIRDVYPANREIQKGLKALNNQKTSAAISSFKRALRNREPGVKIFANFFLARSYRRGGQLADATSAYENMLTLPEGGQHFYAPHARFESGEVYRKLGDWAKAEKAYNALASFGSSWKARGQFGRGVSLLAQGKAKQASSVFKSLMSSASGETLGLAKVGKARADIQLGRSAGAEKELNRLLRDKENSKAVQGMALVGVGELRKASDATAALLAYMRSVLLYGSEGSFSDARDGAVAVATTLKASGLVARLKNYAGSGSYTGDRPDTHYIKQLMGFSAQLAGDEAKRLMPLADSEEKADLEFLYCDSLRYTKKMKEFEKALAAAQKRYPNHPRARDGKIDLLFTQHDELKRQFKARRDEADLAKRAQIVKDVQAGYQKLWPEFKKVVVEARKTCEPIEEIEDASKYKDKNVYQLRRRDAFEMRLVEMLHDGALTFAKGSKDRGDRLNEALTEVDNFTLDRGENYSFDLLANAFKMKGRILLDLGRSEEAVEEFESLKEYVAPINVPNEDVMAKIRQFEREIKISGYRLFALSCARSGQYEKAISAFDELERSIKGYERTREGLLAKFELAKCYAGAGRTTAALDIIFPLIEDPKSVQVEGINPEGLRVEARKALAELSLAAGGEIFPAKIQYNVGLGFKSMGDDESAIVGYKGVLMSASTAQERAEWVPLSVMEMGTLLFFQERYLEAALAYRVLYREFSSHPKATQAVKYARNCVKMAMTQFGEDESQGGPITSLRKEIEVDLSRIVGGASKAQLVMKEAGSLMQERNYERAADKYLEVDSESKDKSTGKTQRIKFYPNAIANAGYCYFKAAEASEDEAKSAELLANAKSNLEKALGIATEWKDDLSQALAAYYLGELLNFVGGREAKAGDAAKAKKSYAEAAAALSVFDGPLGKSDAFATRARLQQVTSFLALGRPREAEARYETIKDRRGSTDRTIIVLDLADWFSTKANKDSKSEIDGYALADLKAKAASYAALWVDASKKIDSSGLLWAAGVIRAGGLDSEAVKVYERLEKQSPRPEVDTSLSGPKAAKHDELHTRYDYAELNLARAYLAGGQVQKAEQRLRALRNLTTVKRGSSLRYRGQLVKEERMTVTDGKGRRLKRKVYTVKIGDKETQFMVPPSASAPKVVEGTDASRTYERSELLVLRQRFKSNYVVLEALATASWKLYQKSRDTAYLVKQVQADWNQLFIFLRKGLDEDRYKGIAADESLEEANYEERCMQVAHRLLQISMERENWKKVVADIESFESLGYLKANTPTDKSGISAGLVKKFMDLKAQAQSR